MPSRSPSPYPSTISIVRDHIVPSVADGDVDLCEKAKVLNKCEGEQFLKNSLKHKLSLEPEV